MIFGSSKRVLKPMRLLVPGVLVALLAGCTSYGVVQNAPETVEKSAPSYSLRTFQERWRPDDNPLMLAFSGGGTRAAALSDGVLKELRDTPVPGTDGDKRLLVEIHSISSVSGGSFTAAYYGLHGEGIFEDFEDVFLRQEVQGALFRRLLNPFRWFSKTGRTEMAVNYYEETVFQGATFGDMFRPDRPLVVINASDFGAGVRFSFVQEYFTLLCSDLSSFPVSRAVAASSAVPILFNPVVVENYSGCGPEAQAWLQEVQERVRDSPDLVMVADGLASYGDKDLRHYIHFVDGGISDNLGLRAPYEVVELNGGFLQYAEKMKRKPPRHLVLISVNAATDAQSTMDKTTRQPSIAVSIGALAMKS